MDPVSVVQTVFSALGALKVAVDTMAANREAADALAKQVKRTGNRLQAALAMGLHSSHPGLQQEVPASLKDIDDALFSAIQAVCSHFLAGRCARFVRGKGFALRLQQADGAIANSEEDFHKTLQLLSMERLLRPAAVQSQPAEAEVVRLMPPTWAEFQLPSLPTRAEYQLRSLPNESNARNREIMVLVARLAVADSEPLLLALLGQLEQHARAVFFVAEAGALPVLLYLINRSSTRVQQKAVEVMNSIGRRRAAAPARKADRPDASPRGQADSDASSRGCQEAAPVVMVPSKPRSSSSSHGASVRESSTGGEGALARSSGLVAALVALLERTAFIRAQVAGALANLALDSPARHREIVAAGGVTALTKMLGSCRVMEEQRAAAAALCNMAASSLPAEQVDDAGHMVAAVIMDNMDERAAQAAAGALRNLTFYAAKRTAATAATDSAAAKQDQAAVQATSGGLQPAAGAVQGGEDAARKGAVQSMPNIPAAKSHTYYTLVLADFLDTGPSPPAQSAAAAALANIAATSGDLRAFVGSKAIPRLVALLGSSSPDVQQSATTALHNCAVGSPANQAAIREQGGIEALEQLLGTSWSPGVQDVATALLSTLSASSLADASQDAAGVGGQLPPPDSGNEEGGQLPLPDSGTEADSVGHSQTPDSDADAGSVGLLPPPDGDTEARGVVHLPPPDSDT